jgi:hypothetical protein
MLCKKCKVGAGAIKYKEKRTKGGFTRRGKRYQQGSGHVCMCMCIYKCMRIMGRCGLDWSRFGWDGDGDDKNDQDVERNEL